MAREGFQLGHRVVPIAVHGQMVGGYRIENDNHDWWLDFGRGSRVDALRQRSGATCGDADERGRNQKEKPTYGKGVR